MPGSVTTTTGGRREEAGGRIGRGGQPGVGRGKGRWPLRQRRQQWLRQRVGPSSPHLCTKENL